SGGAGRGELILASGRAGQTQTRGRNGLATADVLVGEGGRSAREADGIAADHAAESAGRDRGGGRAVVGLIVGGDAARQEFLGDREGLIHAGRRIPVGI